VPISQFGAHDSDDIIPVVRVHEFEQTARHASTEEKIH
jgi:hypothetical protein